MSADGLYQQAQSTLASAGKGFSFFGNKQDKYEEAADKFRDAANAYRKDRNLQKSGQAFEKAAEIQSTHMKDQLEAAKMLQDAFKSYRDVAPSDAARVLRRSVDMYTAKGNFRRAADLMQDLAEMYEKMEGTGKQGEHLTQALQCLETSIQWYNDEGIHATANKARQKAGMMAAVLGDYYKAVSIFVTGAEASLNSGPTGRFIVKTYLFKAGICQLATGDVVGARKAIESWNTLDRGFDQEREGRFLRDLIDALEAQDADAVAQIAADWDRMTKMEDWMVTVLLQVKKAAEGEEEDFS